MVLLKRLLNSIHLKLLFSIQYFRKVYEGFPVFLGTGSGWDRDIVLESLFLTLNKYLATQLTQTIQNNDFQVCNNKVISLRLQI